MSIFYAKYAGGNNGSGGVVSLNSLTGALSLTSTGTTVTITPSGSTINLEVPTGAGLIFIDSLTNFAGNVSLLNDSGAPGNNKYYGTNSGGTNGWYSLPVTATGNLTDVGTDGITVTGGTGAVVGSGTSLSQHVADISHNGYLSSTDWNTFNGKLTSTLASGDLFVGNGFNVATAVAATGDISLANTGSFTVTGLQANPVNSITPTTGYILTWDGSQWSPIAGINPIVGDTLTLWPVNTNIISGPTIPTSVTTLLTNPTVTGPTSSSIVVNNNTLLIDVHTYNTALGITSIPSGAWIFNLYASTSATTNTPQLITNACKVVAGAGTVTVSGSGTTRTVTATSSMFVSGDFNASITSTSYVQVPGGIFPVASFSSGTVVTITTPSGYVNDGAGSSYTVYRVLFGSTITLTSTASLLYVTSNAQAAFTINTTDKLAFMFYGKSTGSGNRTITYFQDGNAANSSVGAPITGISGLGAGVVRSTAAGVLSSAELSGDVTTSGSNVTTAAATQNNITSVPNLATVGTISNGTWAGTTVAVNHGGTGVTTSTGSGSVVLSSAPTLTNPVVGTQSQLDGSTKAASTSYVDTAVANAVAGINPAVAVQAATTAAGDTSSYVYANGVSGIGATLTAGTANVALTVDGFTFTALGQRLLVKNDTQSPSGAFNGVYSVTILQAPAVKLVLTRALDYDTPSDMNNTGAIPVINGTANGTTSWVLTSQITTVGTDPLTFTKFTRNPADYLLAANNLSDVSTKATAFNNISPMTTGGDLIYGGASGAGTRLANGSSGQILTSAGGTSAPTWSAPITNNYFNGSLQLSTTNSWSTTSSTYAAMSASGGSSTLTTRQSNGISVSAAASNAAGITFTPSSSTAVYWVSATTIGTNGVSATSGLKLTDGTVDVCQTPIQTASTSTVSPMTMTGVYVPGTGSAVTLSLKGATSSGTFNIGYGSGQAAQWNGIEWQIHQIK